MVISNVTGDTLSRGVGVTAESYNTDYWGSFRTIRVKGISLCVHGDPSNGFTAKMNTAHVVIGKEGPNGVSSTKNNFAWEVSVSDVQCRGSAYSMGGVFVGHMAIRQLIIGNVQCVYDDAAQITRAVIIAGQKDIQLVNISNIQQQGNAALSDFDRAGRCAIESYYGGAAAMDLTTNSFTKLLNAAGTTYVPNVSFVQVSGQSKTIPRLFGDDSMICDLDAAPSGGVKGVPKAHGVNFATPSLGRISYSKITDSWTFHDFAVQWDATNYGMPSAANFPNYALFDWRAGTIVPVKGSPYGERKEYVALSAKPTFAPNDAVCWSTNPAIQSSDSTPLSFTPGCVVWGYLPAQADAGWAYQNVGMVQYLITNNSTRLGSKRIQYDSSGTSAQRVQAWNGSSWGTWQNLSV